MKKDWKCLRCGVDMVYLGVREFQLGRETIWVDTHRMEGTMELELFGCPQCGKTEFFAGHMDEMIAERQLVCCCPVCHTKYPGAEDRCPKCLTKREEA